MPAHHLAVTHDTATNFQSMPSSCGDLGDQTRIVRRGVTPTCAATSVKQTVPPSSKHGDYAGRVGLTNLGNTCFMNAGLQCLSHLEPLVRYFRRGEYLKEMREKGDNEIGEVANAFAELQQLVWEGNYPVVNPQKLRQKLATRNPYLFDGYEQQDVQEFFAFCLDGLHEDLNRVKEKPTPLTEEQAAEEEILCMEQGEEFVATLYWIRHLMHGRSFLVDLLQGQLRSKTSCIRCGHESRHFEPFLYLSLPVARSMVYLTDAVDAFLEAELLEGDNGWWCPRCQSKGSAHRKIDLWKLPPVLVVHLKRFEFCSRTFSFRKLNVHLQTPESVDFSPYCSESVQKSGAQYLLSCVANHHGPFGSGHYTATCRLKSASRAWYRFDDDRVRTLPTNEEPVSDSAYVLFFVRTEVNGHHGAAAKAIRAPRRQTLAMPEDWPHKASSRNSVMASLLPTGAAATALLTAKDHVLAQQMQEEEDKAQTQEQHQHYHQWQQQQQHQQQHQVQVESQQRRNVEGRLRAPSQPERLQRQRVEVEQRRNQAGPHEAPAFSEHVRLLKKKVDQGQMDGSGYHRQCTAQHDVPKGYPKTNVAQPCNPERLATTAPSVKETRMCPTPPQRHHHQQLPRNQSAPSHTQQQHRVKTTMSTASDLQNSAIFRR